MTWAEFKKAIEAAGIVDTDELNPSGKTYTVLHVGVVLDGILSIWIDDKESVVRPSAD